MAKPKGPAGRDNSGSIGAEFAILAPLAIALMFGVIEAGRILFLLSAMGSGLSAAARMQMLNPAATDADLRSAFCEGLTATDCEGSTVTVALQTTNGRTWRRVTATTPFASPLALLVPLPTELTQSRTTPVL
jgi:Flp pilus assembly protein TadG